MRDKLKRLQHDSSLPTSTNQRDLPGGGKTAARFAARELIAFQSAKIVGRRLNNNDIPDVENSTFLMGKEAVIPEGYSLKIGMFPRPKEAYYADGAFDPSGLVGPSGLPTDLLDQGIAIAESSGIGEILTYNGEDYAPLRAERYEIKSRFPKIVVLKDTLGADPDEPGAEVPSGFNTTSLTLSFPEVTADRIQVFQDSDGTVALTSDIVDYSAQINAISGVLSETPGFSHRASDVSAFCSGIASGIPWQVYHFQDSNDISNFNYINISGSNASGIISNDFYGHHVLSNANISLVDGIPTTPGYFGSLVHKSVQLGTGYASGIAACFSLFCPSDASDTRAGVFLAKEYPSTAKKVVKVQVSQILEGERLSVVEGTDQLSDLTTLFSSYSLGIAQKVILALVKNSASSVSTYISIDGRTWTDLGVSAITTDWLDGDSHPGFCWTMKNGGRISTSIDWISIYVKAA